MQRLTPRHGNVSRRRLRFARDRGRGVQLGRTGAAGPTIHRDPVLLNELVDQGVDRDGDRPSPRRTDGVELLPCFRPNPDAEVEWLVAQGVTHDTN